jgi:hypothetical protein
MHKEGEAENHSGYRIMAEGVLAPNDARDTFRAEVHRDASTIFLHRRNIGVLR